MKEMKRQKTSDEQENQKHNSFKKLLTKKYGFAANQSIPTWKTAQQIILQTPTELYFVQPHNKAIFNLANTKDGLPRGTYSLLSLRLKFCIKSPSPTNNINTSIARFEHDVRTKFLMRNEIDTGLSTNLYIRNPEWDPPKANEKVEMALNKFRETITLHQAKFQKNSRPNITCLQNSALRNLTNNGKFITIWADKNMGVVIML